MRTCGRCARCCSCVAVGGAGGSLRRAFRAACQSCLRETPPPDSVTVSTALDVANWGVDEPVSTPTPSKSDSSPSGNGTVKPGGSKGVWEYCTSDSECQNGCCSDQLSDDYEKKCTPNVCSRLQASKKDQWQFCSSSDECANSCCSNRLSDDGKMKCTPGGAC